MPKAQKARLRCKLGTGCMCVSHFQNKLPAQPSPVEANRAPSTPTKPPLGSETLRPSRSLWYLRKNYGGYMEELAVCTACTPGPAAQTGPPCWTPAGVNGRLPVMTHVPSHCQCSTARTALQVSVLFATLLRSRGMRARPDVIQRRRAGVPDGDARGSSGPL